MHAYNQVLGLQQENTALKNEVAFLRDQLQKAQRNSNNHPPQASAQSQQQTQQTQSTGFSLSSSSNGSSQLVMIDDETLLQVLQQKEREIDMLKQELLLKESEVDALREEREQFFEMQKSEEELIHIALHSGNPTAAATPSSASSSSTFNLDLLMSDRPYPHTSSLYDAPQSFPPRPARSSYPATNNSTKLQPQTPQSQQDPTSMQIDKDSFTGFLLQPPPLLAQQQTQQQPPQQPHLATSSDYLHFLGRHTPPPQQQQPTAPMWSSPEQQTQPEQPLPPTPPHRSPQQQPQPSPPQQQQQQRSPQDVQQPAFMESRGPWVCSFCTLTNNSDARFCAVCARPR